MTGQKFSLDLLNQKGKIGTDEAQAWRGDTMVLDVWWNVFVMRMSTGETLIVRVGLRIVPVKLLIATPDLVAIAFNLTWRLGKGQLLAHNQAEAVR